MSDIAITKRDFIDRDHAVTVQLERGMKIEVVSGPLAGMQGHVLEVQPFGMIRISISEQEYPALADDCRPVVRFT